MQLYASADDLPNCSQKYEGIQALVSDESLIYQCNDGRWSGYIKVYASEDEMPNCTSKRTGEIAYIQKTAKTLICTSDKWNVWDGKPVELPKSSASESSSSSQNTAPNTSDSPSSSSKELEQSSSSTPPRSSSSSSVILPRSSSSEVRSSSSQEVEPSYACANAMWCGPRGDLQVNTGSSDEKHGWWYGFTDSYANGGNSTIEWPVSSAKNDNVAPVIEAKGAVVGRFVLGSTKPVNGTSDPFDPFALVGFNLVNGNNDPMDITDWKGICITYSATDRVDLQIKEPDKYISTGYDNYHVTLSKTSDLVTKNFRWADFEQYGWGTATEIETVLQWAGSIHLYYQAPVNSINSFKITAFGKYGTCGD